MSDFIHFEKGLPVTDAYQIVNSDCIEAMRGMDECSVDCIVTDPPYGLAFMGAKWDSFNVSNGRQTIGERQDEGKRYASENKGAPRYGNSHGKRVTPSEMREFQERMTPIFEEALRVVKPGGHMLCFGGTRTFHRLACAIEDAGWNVRDCIMWVYGSGFPHGMDVSKAIDKALGAKRDGSDPATEMAAQWEGWNTQLKPAWEPVIVAQKSLDGTVAHNVMTYGTGAINIDGCMVPTEDNLNGGTYSGTRRDDGSDIFGKSNNGIGRYVQPSGRFPANLVHDGSQEVLELFPDSKGQQGKVSGNEPSRTGDNGIYGRYGQRNEFVPRGDSGSAARFFYCAKASKRDRGEGNDHPTVKPNALMRWLVRLVCQKGGTVLDPFMGSGSTGVACIQEGMRFVGIDMDEHYCDIAQRRIGAAYSQEVV